MILSITRSTGMSDYLPCDKDSSPSCCKCVHRYPYSLLLSLSEQFVCHVTTVMSMAGPWFVVLRQLSAETERLSVLPLW